MKKKIYIYLSDSNNVFDINDQYLYIKQNIDKKLYLEIIDNIFENNNILSKNKILGELNKIIDKKIDLLKPKYSKNELINELLDINLGTYDLPLNISFLNKNNDNIICEYADIRKNEDQDNIYNDRVENNNFKLLNNINFNNTIYLYDLENLKNYSNLENLNYIIERYWIDDKNISINKKDILNVFSDINEKYENIYDLKNHKINNLENSINGIIFINHNLK